MKKLLMISYYFPPLGMGGTQRPAKFAKYLHEFGWQPTVLTVKPVAYFAQDQSLLNELAHVRIIRTESWDPQRLLARLGRQRDAAAGQSAGGGIGRWINEKLLPFVLQPDSKRLWLAHACRTARKLLRSESFDAVYTTSPPHSVQLLGLELKKRFEIPWIADFRDAWAGGVVVHEPTKYQYQHNLRLQKQVLNAADAVLSVTPGLARDLQPLAGDTPVQLLTNGFDPEDYPESRRSDDRFVLCHCGSITKFSHPDVVLHACALMKEKYPDGSKTFRLQFVGYDALGDLEKRVERYGIHDMVDIVGYQPHTKALEYLVSADALLLIAQGRKQDRFIPGKVFEYIGAQKPILAVCNVDDTRNLLRQSKTAVVVQPQAPDVAEAMQSLMRDKGSIQAEPDFARQYERREQTRKLTQILERL
ncbi:MAG: glycosyltransferase family 4 protein [candidate division KSB1 bacterium]|nr:glycosyltransferase family 4 protein [candidate division KSB1 bacterium]